MCSQTRQNQYRYNAHLFHIGDARIHRLPNGSMEQLTDDHRIWIAQDQSHLSRTLWIDSHLEIDYRALQLEQGNIFVLTTDGIHEHVPDARMTELIAGCAPLLERNPLRFWQCTAAILATIVALFIVFWPR
jgi:serine/threonine protein phosphatase PrpC